MMCRYCVTGYQSRRSDIPEKNDPSRGRGARILRQHQGNHCDRYDMNN